MRIGKQQKKKRKGYVVLGLSVIMACFLAMGITASADSAIQSKGRLILEDSDAALYAADIHFVQDEIGALSLEVTEEGAVSHGTKVRSDRIKSKGTIDYADSTVTFHSSDLKYLAGEIDELESVYKSETLLALNQIHTYFNGDGSVTHEESTTEDAASLTFSQLKNGILNSQTVTTGTTADHVSLDKGAWVNGCYIIGNGNDVNAAYAQGFKDGVDKTMENAQITYIYHRHIKGDGTESENTIYGYDAPGGCYVSAGHTHNVTEGCPVSEYPTTMVSVPCGSFRYGGEDENGNTYYVCDVCGTTANKYGANDGENDGGEHYRGVEITDYDHPIYGCGTPVNTWRLGCNKTTSTIESATITFY